MNNDTFVKSPEIEESPEQTRLRQVLQNKIKEVISERPTPGTPVEVGITVFRMKFKKGPTSQEVFFQFSNDQKLAEVAARDYCTKFRLRFIWVEKFFIDIFSQPQEEEVAT